MVPSGALALLPKDFGEKLAIMRMLDAPPGELRVNRFCAEKGVSRKKFYRLFSSKYDVIFWYYDACNEIGIYRIGRDLSWHEGIVNQLMMLDEERQTLLLATRERKTLNALSENVVRSRAKRREVIRETLTVHRGVEVCHFLEAEIEIYINIEADVMSLWTMGEVSRNAEEFACFWERCVPRRLYEAMSLKGDAGQTECINLTY